MTPDDESPTPPPSLPPGARPLTERVSKLRARFRSDFFSVVPEDLENYGKDWSGVLEPAPSAIAFPRSTLEVSDLLRACTELGLPVVPSGGRTGLSGGAVAARGEVVLSLEKMNRMGEVDLASFTLEVEAGAITEAVHEHAKKVRLTWPVDFASKGSSQVGGNLSTNAGGVRVIRYGLTRNWVLGLTVVTMDGEILRLNGALEKNNTGIDLRQVFIGSEGTLGVITEATLKLSPLPDDERTRVCLFAVPDFTSVLELFSRARTGPFLISAFETFSDPCLQEVVASGLRSPFTTRDAGAYVLLECEERDVESMEAWLGEVLSARHGEKELVLDAVMAQSSRERAEFWALREQIAEAILSRGETHQQDLSVPLARLGEFFAGIEPRYRSAYPDFSVFIFGHIGDGNLHIFIRKPDTLESAEFHRLCAESDIGLFELCEANQGSVSAEHGIGLLKKPALRYSRTPEELAYCRALKQVFDPRGLLNPGKIL